MTTSSEDLWPDDLGAQPTDKTPLVILREQAAKLGEKTGNVVEGEVSVHPHPDGKSLSIRLTVIAPALGGYEYVLLEATQPVELYPVTMHFEDGRWVANDERGFKQYLKNLFNSQRTKALIANLVAQSKVL